MTTVKAVATGTAALSAKEARVSDPGNAGAGAAREAGPARGTAPPPAAPPRAPVPARPAPWPAGTPGNAGAGARPSRAAWSRTFAGTAGQVGEARRFLAAVLGGHPAAGDAVLCLSELAANAIIHSRSGEPGGVFTVRVLRLAGRPGEPVPARGPERPRRAGPAGGERPDPPPPARARDPAGRARPGGCRVEVRDAGGPWRPRGGGAAPGAGPAFPGARGNGLAIVAALCTRWGISGGEDGRVAWFEIGPP